MEIACEHVVQKKVELKDILAFTAKSTGLLLASVAIAYALLIFDLMELMSLALLAFFAAVWIIIVMFRNMRVEYEYAYLESTDELVVDKIINMNKRKNLAMIPAKSIEQTGEYNHETFDADGGSVHYYTSVRKPENAIFYMIRDGRNKKVFVVLERDERVFNALKRAMNPAVYREGFLKKK